MLKLKTKVSSVIEKEWKTYHVSSMHAPHDKIESVTTVRSDWGKDKGDVDAWRLKLDWSNAQRAARDQTAMQ